MCVAGYCRDQNPHTANMELKSKKGKGKKTVCLVFVMKNAGMYHAMCTLCSYYKHTRMQSVYHLLLKGQSKYAVTDTLEVIRSEQFRLKSETTVQD